VRLSRTEVERIRYWIESGAPYPGTYAALGSGMIGGYDENRQVLTDFDWPETKAAAEAMNRRCDSCHQGPSRLPHALSDENTPSFWRPNWSDRRLHLSRHVVFSLTRPEQSLVLLAPLARKAGGYGACKDPKTGQGGEVVEVFGNTNDADYQKILAAIRRGKRTLDEITRFDMPGFRPTPYYVREMKRYGVLPDSLDAAKDPIDVYATDRAYWRSLWWQPRRK
jgi:hypothetical protein